LSKTFIERIVEVTRAQVPLWACELTSRHIIVAGVNRQRNKVKGKLAAGLRTQSVTGSLTETNIANKEATRDAVLDALNQAGFEGSEIVVIVPDDAVRIAFLTVEKLSKHPEEQQTFIRWKFKKPCPLTWVRTDRCILGTRPDGSSVCS
jgi:Tfp pilus assembly PilM family ATPase